MHMLANNVYFNGNVHVLLLHIPPKTVYEISFVVCSRADLYLIGVLEKSE